MKERNSLDKEKINGECDVLMILMDGKWERDGLERWCPRDSGPARHLTLERCYVGSVDDKSAVCVVRGDRAVVDEVVPEDGAELLFVQSPQEPVQASGKICLLDLARKHCLCWATVDSSV